MRRGLTAILLASSLLGMTSSVIGQSPYPSPYGPMPVQYQPQYGYPAPMPMPYPQNPAMMRPMPYPQPQPAMMRPMPQQWQSPPMNQPRVYNFGPLTPMPQEAAPMQEQAAPDNTSSATPVSFGKKTQPTLPSLPNMSLPPEACGPECEANAACPAPVRPLPAPGRGHFISTLGMWYLVPYPGTNTAFTTTAGGNTATTEFDRETQYGPRASFGYVFHNCWGVRGNYSYLTGDVNQSINNASTGTTIATPLNAPFRIASPSAALTAGLAPDQFNFRQKFDIHVADVELLREASLMDTTFMFSLGARYVRTEQTYLASRTNPGGTTAATRVALSQEDLETASRFNGWGPTVSFDVTHPILPCGISGYGNVRGSYLFGNDRFTQTYRNQNRTVTAAGVATFTDNTQTSASYDNRAASIVEGEAGLQYGARLGRCYLFGRAGAVYQRWFDVGTPTTSGGNISFIGGTATVGITY